MKRFILIGLFVLNYAATQAQNSARTTAEAIKVLPGKGVVINADTIKLNITIADLLPLHLEIQESPYPRHSISCGFDDEGNDFSFVTYMKDYLYKNIVFSFHSTDTLKFELREIEIRYDSLSPVKINDRLWLGDQNPNLSRSFYRRRKYDYIEGNRCIYYSRGIEFYTDERGKTKILSKLIIREGN